MSMLVPWLVFPAVLGLLSLGCGLLVEYVAGTRLHALVIPVGFATIAVASLLTTTNGATARLTTPVVIALAVAGFGLALPARGLRPDAWATAAAVSVYAVFAAPVVASGTATFAGYIKLDDTASWLGQTDRLLSHGRTLTGLPPSSYEAMLNYYWQQYGYPVGAFPPLGVAHTLLRVDSAWLFQPYLCFLAAMLALAVYGLLRRVVGSTWLRALASFVAAQPTLLYGYSLWGGVKELAVAAFLVLIAALLPPTVQERATVRAAVPAAIVSAALLGVLNLSGGVWLAPLLVPALVAGLWLRRRAFLPVAAAFAVLTAALSLPSLLLVGSFLKDVSLNAKGGDPGNLIHPLSKFQVLGIWPVGDFRLRPGNMPATYFLIAFLLLAALAGVYLAWERRAWELPLYALATLVGCAIAVRGGSSWIGGKALAIGSPVVLVVGMAGVAFLFKGGRRVEAAVVTAAIVGGVLWSNALAYHDVWLAPRSQLQELETVGKSFAGQGPTLMTEYQSYGVRHFLRNLDPEAAGELRRRQIPLRNGKLVEKGNWADIDEFQLDAVLVYRTLVLNRSPVASRPPSVYRLVWSGRYYDVWQRPDTQGARILEHLPLGGGNQPAAIPTCSDVLRLADEASAAGGSLSAVFRSPATVVQLSAASHPASWATYSGSPDVVYPSGPGTLQATVSVPAAGRYGVWLGGSFRRRLEVSVDGRRVGEARHRLSHPGVFTPLGKIELARGSHTVTLRYSAANSSPGSGGTPFPLGPLVLGRSTAELPVATVRPADAAGSLCNKSLDWVEAVKP